MSARLHGLAGIFSVFLGSKVVDLKSKCKGDLCHFIYLLLPDFTGLYRGCSGGKDERRTAAR